MGELATTRDREIQIDLRIGANALKAIRRGNGDIDAMPAEHLRCAKMAAEEIPNASPRFALEAAEQFLASFPQRYDFDLTQYAASLVRTTAGYPEATIAAAYAELLATMKFIPSIAEVVTALKSEQFRLFEQPRVKAMNALRKQGINMGFKPLAEVRAANADRED